MSGRSARIVWENRDQCHRCGEPPGTPCTSLGDRRGTGKGEPMVKPHQGRRSVRGRGRVADRDLIDSRMAIWKTLCGREVPVADIAEALRMSRDGLLQMVHRERKAGNEMAVYHPGAHFKSEQPTQRERRGRRYRAEERRARQQERRERQDWFEQWLMRDSEDDETEE